MAVKLNSRTPKPPQLPPAAELALSPAFVPYDGDLYTGIRVTKASLAGREVDHLVIEGSILETVALTETKFRRLELSDVAFRNCDIANATWNAFESRRVAFNACRLMGAKVIEGTFADVSFTDCQFQFAQLRFSKLQGALFETCNLRDCDFSGADLTGATFDRCDLTGAMFVGAKLDRVDLRSSAIEGIAVGPDDIKGAIVTALQAIVIASVFGLSVLDEHADIEEAPKAKR